MDGRAAARPRRRQACCHRVGWVAAHCQRAAKRQERRVQRHGTQRHGTQRNDTQRHETLHRRRALVEPLAASASLAPETTKEPCLERSGEKADAALHERTKGSILPRTASADGHLHKPTPFWSPRRQAISQAASARQATSFAKKGCPDGTRKQNRTCLPTTNRPSCRHVGAWCQHGAAHGMPQKCCVRRPQSSIFHTSAERSHQEFYMLTVLDLNYQKHTTSRTRNSQRLCVGCVYTHTHTHTSPPLLHPHPSLCPWSPSLLL